MGDIVKVEGDTGRYRKIKDWGYRDPGEIHRDLGRSEGNTGRFWENILRCIGDTKRFIGDEGKSRHMHPREVQGDSKKIQGYPREMQGDLGCEIHARYCEIGRRYGKMQDCKYREDRRRLIENTGRSRGDRYTEI
jgi:hypothetical protein